MVKLNLCCGTNVFPNWTNVDKTDVDADYLRHLRDAPPGFVWPPRQQPIADAVLAGKLEFIQYDVRRGLLLWEDASVDAIYLGQCVEHFNAETELPALLRECFRVLKRGGAVRAVTPDLHKLIAAYNHGELGKFSGDQPAYYLTANPEDRLAYLLYGATGPGCTTENFEGHFHCYTHTTLKKRLDACGFAVHNAAPGAFADTIDMGMSHSFAIEGCKP